LKEDLIFEEDWDRNRFQDCLGSIVEENGTRCLARALVPNHAHLLLKIGRVLQADGTSKRSPPGDQIFPTTAI